jgi:hypothetical protein
MVYRYYPLGRSEELIQFEIFARLIPHSIGYSIDFRFICGYYSGQIFTMSLIPAIRFLDSPIG